MLPRFPRPEYESQKEPHSHTLVCESQRRMRQSRLHRDLGRTVYALRIATQASLHQLQHRRWFRRNLSCCLDHRKMSVTQIVVSMRVFDYYQHQIQQHQTMRVSEQLHPKQEYALHLLLPLAFVHQTSR